MVIYAEENFPADPSPTPAVSLSCPSPTYRLYHSADAGDQPAILSDSFPNLGEDWNDKVGALYIYPGAVIAILEGALIPGEGYYDNISRWDFEAEAGERGLLITPLVFPDWMTSATWEVMQGINLYGSAYGASAVLIRKCPDPSISPIPSGGE